MQVSRVVKISYYDQNNMWKDMSRAIFSDYIFQIPSPFPNLTIPEEGAHIFLEFVEESPLLLNYAQIGSDPYQRPFLYAFIIKIKSTIEIPTGLLNHIHHWVAQANMIGSTWCILLFQEESSFFGTVKPISKISLVQEQVYEQNVLIIPCKKNSKIADQWVEIIRAKFRDLLTRSFIMYEEEAWKKISKTKSNPESILKLKNWHSLLLFYFGFMNNSYISFQECYDSIVSKINSASEEYLPSLDPVWVTQYPLANGNEPKTLLEYSFAGLMAVSYARTRFSECVNVFLRHWGIISSYCETRAQYVFVEDWAEQTINIILTISEFSSRYDVSYLLLEKLFYLQLNKNSKEVKNTYQRYMGALPSSHSFSRIAANTRFVKWANLHEKGYPDFSDSIMGWRFGVKSAMIRFQNAVSKSIFSEIEYFSKLLLSDKAQYDQKLELVHQLSVIDNIFSITNPFVVLPKFLSSYFGGNIYQYQTTDISLRLIFPSWFLINNCLLIASFVNKSSHLIKESTINEYICHRINHMSVFFSEEGEWIFDSFKIIIGNFSMKWYIDQRLHSYKFTVHNIIEPKVHVDFPLLTGINKIMKANISFDFSTISNSSIEISLCFDSSSLKITTNNTFAVFENDNIKKQYPIYLKDTKVFMCDEKNDGCTPVSPSGFKVSFPFDFMQYEPLGFTYLSVRTKVANTEYLSKHLLKFDFPIECYIRMITESHIQFCIKNVSNESLLIESIEFLPDVWNKRLIGPKEEIYLIGRNDESPDSKINIFVSEPNGSSIAQSWIIGKIQHMNTINIEFDESDLAVGQATAITCSLPESEIYLESSESVIIIGLFKKTCFKGGRFQFEIIPVKTGILQIPKISINGITYNYNPAFINVPENNVSTFKQPLIEVENQ